MAASPQPGFASRWHGVSSPGYAAPARRRLHLAAIAALFLASPLTAEPASIAVDNIPALKLEMVADDSIGGVSARMQGETGPDATRYFYVEGLNVMSPVAIRVLATDPAKPVNVALHRGFWSRAELTATTDEQGNFSSDTRIDGDLGVAISAVQTAGFYLLIWTDKPVEVPMPKVVFIDGKLVDMNAKEGQ